MTENIKQRAPAEGVADPEWVNWFRQDRQGGDSLEEVLAQVPIFSLLNHEELGILAREVYRRTYRAGELVVRCGVEQSGLYLIRSGEVHQFEGGSQRRLVAQLGPGQILGELALLDDIPHPYDAVAAGYCELVGFFEPSLKDIMITNPGMGCKIVLRLAEETSNKLGRRYWDLAALGYPQQMENQKDTGQKLHTIFV